MNSSRHLNLGGKSSIRSSAYIHFPADLTYVEQFVHVAEGQLFTIYITVDR